MRFISDTHELHAEQTVAAARAGNTSLEKADAIRVADCQQYRSRRAAGRGGAGVGPSHGFDAPVQRLLATRLGAIRSSAAKRS